MKVTFWLLDISYEVKDGLPEIWLWGIDGSQRRVLIIDRSFLAYFYVVIQEGFVRGEVVDEIERLHHPSVVKLEVVERKLLGKPVEAVKVYCRNPDEVSKCAASLREIEGVRDCLEDDIRYAMRYLIDNEVVPCGWHKVDVTEGTPNSDVQVDAIYSAMSPPAFLERPGVPYLRVLGFSTIAYSREGSPKPDRNPVILISVATDNGEEKQFVARDGKNDKPVLTSLIEYVRSYDPDIIIGYGVNGQDWPYLKNRCGNLQLPFHVGRTKTEPHQSTYGHFSVAGRANVDLMDYSEDFTDVKVKTLANLTDYLGIVKLENRVIVEEVDFANYWDTEEKREVLKNFSRENTQCIMGMATAIMDFALQLSSLVGLPLDHIGTAAAGFRVEWFTIRHVHKTGELVPRRVEQPYRPYAGGMVLEPKPGLHENIAVLDFKSMYPNIMITYNLSPDTYVSPEESIPSDQVFEAPEVKHRFRKKPTGFYTEILFYLIKVRDDIRQRMKQVAPKSVEYSVLDARQRALKIITNAAYGYVGWTGARWFVKPVAEATAAYGRYTIKTAIKMAEKAGLNVVYGDTDSIFVGYEQERVEAFSKDVQRKLGLEIKPEKIYVRVFFTEAKKRYAGLLPDGRLDIVGMEVMRGDWAGIAKKVQVRVLEMILKETSPKKAVKVVQGFIQDLNQKRVPYRDLIIWKTLTKPAEEYEVRASHVEAARLLKERGWQLGVGDKVGYVVVVGSGRLYEKVKPYVIASYEEIDTEYYASKQIIPAATRVLESFGVTAEEILGIKRQEKGAKSLTDFFES